MALLLNNLPVIGIVITDGSQRMFNNQPVIGVRAAEDDAAFERNHVVRGVEEVTNGASIWNDQPVRGVFEISDDRTIYNGQPVLPVIGIDNWSPASLFKNGEQGWLMDLSLASLFQDAAGTIPVTEPGQPVGLVLDKSQGLELGPELVTNGDFSNGLTEWTDSSTGTGSVFASGGAVTLIGTELANRAALSKNISSVLSAGKQYEVSLDVISFSGSSASLGLGPGVGNAARGGVDVNGAGNHKFITPPIAGSNILWTRTPLDGATYEIDNISVREIPGNHWTQPTALNRPIYQVDAEGNPYLSFNGTNQWMQTAAFDWGSDEVTQVVGIDRKSDKASIAFEFSPAIGTNAGSFYLTVPEQAGGTFRAAARGTATLNPTMSAMSAAAGLPDVSVISAQHSISGSRSDIWKNGVSGTPGTGDKGSGNFGNYPLFIGSRGAGSLPFTGNMYPSLGINRLLSEAELASAEDWAAKRTGGLTA